MITLQSRIDDTGNKMKSAIFVVSAILLVAALAEGASIHVREKRHHLDVIDPGFGASWHDHFRPDNTGVAENNAESQAGAESQSFGNQGGSQASSEGNANAGSQGQGGGSHAFSQAGSNAQSGGFGAGSNSYSNAGSSAGASGALAKASSESKSQSFAGGNGSFSSSSSSASSFSTGGKLFHF